MSVDVSRSPSFLKRRHSRGAALLEMTLLGIPIMFVLISVFEISRGMWMYETAAHAVREGVRFAIVHGRNCEPNPPSITNDCRKSIADVAHEVELAAVGLDPTTTTLIFTSPSPGGTPVTCTIAACQQSPYNDVVAYQWPVHNFNSSGNYLRIDIITPFPSALSMFWPGAGSGVAFGVVNLGASSADAVQF